MSEERETVTITVNGEPVVAEKGELVIAAAERAGTYIPHFCYHPRMASVGMCRMCIVDIDTGRGPALQPACMLRTVAYYSALPVTPRTYRVTRLLPVPAGG